MGDQDARQRATKDAQAENADKAALEAKPNEARMSEIAKRLLSTPPDRQSVGKALAPKQTKTRNSQVRRAKAD